MALRRAIATSIQGWRRYPLRLQWWVSESPDTALPLWTFESAQYGTDAALWFAL